jgi:hypothetical protein
MDSACVSWVGSQLIFPKKQELVNNKGTETSSPINGCDKRRLYAAAVFI